MKRYAKPLLAIVFVALLATPLLVRRFGARALVAPAANADALARYGFTLTEVAKGAGIYFQHEGPTLDPKLNHIMPQVASMGAAVSIVDVDADGHNDLYVVNSREGSLNRLYRNRGDGTFEEVAERLGVADLNQQADRRLDGRRVGRLRQRRLRGPAAAPLGQAGAVPQRRRHALHAGDRDRWPGALGQHQHGRVARLRPRRPAGSSSWAATSRRH